MKTRSLKTVAATISTSRWLAYSGAAAATALAGATSADGEIHYSGRVDVKLGPGSNDTVYLQLDQPGDSIAFRHSTTRLSGRTSGSAYFKAVGLQSGAFVGTYSRFEFAFVDRLKGAPTRYISGFPFTSFGGTIRNFGLMVKGSFRYGEWIKRGTDYVGFRFNNGSGLQYGWARVKMGGKDQNFGFKVLDYAYADPGEPIGVGQTTSPSKTDVTEEGSLGVLAVGAAGLALWRQRRRRS
jgi:MYXO-CTERM domain-containing protein